MSLVEDLTKLVELFKKVESWEIAAAIGWFLATVSPGALILFLYQPILFRELETVKLLVLSVSLTLPLAMVNVLLTVVLNVLSQRGMEASKKETNKSEFFFWQMVWAFFVLYGALLSAYLCSLTINQFMVVAGGLNGLVAVFVFFLFRLLNRTRS